MQLTWVQSLGREDPLEKEMAIHSSTIAWKIPWTDEPGRIQSMGSQRVRHDWATSLSLSNICSVQFSFVTQSCPTLCDPWIAACQASLSIINSRRSLRHTSIKSVMPSSHLILCCPLLLLPPIPPSIRVFSNESTLHMGGQSIGVSALASFLPKKSVADSFGYLAKLIQLCKV